MFVCNGCDVIIKEPIICKNCKWKKYCSDICLDKDKDDHKEHCNVDSIPAKVNMLMTEVSKLEKEYLAMIERIFVRFDIIHDDDMCVTLILNEEQLDDLIQYFDFKRFITLLSHNKKDLVNTFIKNVVDMNMMGNACRYDIHIIMSKELFYSKIGLNLKSKFSYTKFYRLTECYENLDRREIRDVLDRQDEDRILKEYWYYELLHQIWMKFDIKDDKMRYVEACKYLCKKIGEEIPFRIWNGFLKGKKTEYDGNNINIKFSNSDVKKFRGFIDSLTSKLDNRKKKL